MTKRIGVHLGTAGGRLQRRRTRAGDRRQHLPDLFRQARACGARPKSIPRRPTACTSCAPSSTSARWSSTPATWSTSAASRARFARRASTAFRGEIERALALGAEYLVLHPGSWKGLTRDEGLKLAADSIARAIDGLPWQGTPFHILIENTAGAEFSLGGSFEQVAELVERLKPPRPSASALTPATPTSPATTWSAQRATRRR